MTTIHFNGVTPHFEGSRTPKLNAEQAQKTLEGAGFRLAATDVEGMDIYTRQVGGETFTAKLPSGLSGEAKVPGGSNYENQLAVRSAGQKARECRQQGK